MEVKLISFNVLMRPPIIKNNASDYKEARLDYLVQHVLPKYDIVCLQEMFNFGSSRRSRLLEAAFKAGFRHSHVSPEKSLFSGSIDGGLVLLSRYPIRYRDHIVYPVGCHSDRFSDKGVLYAKIELTQNHQLHLFTTHTQASYTHSPPLTDVSVVVRHQQLARLRRFIDTCTEQAGRGPHDLVLIVGDLNVNGRPAHDPTDPNRSTGDSDEYTFMMRILRGEGIPANMANPRLPEDEVRFASKNVITIRDVLKERYGYHPVTFGDVWVDERGEERPRETILTGRIDQGARASLDYVLVVDKDGNVSAGASKSRMVEVDVEKTRVEEFFVGAGGGEIGAENKYPFSQLSDHYAVATVVRVSNPVEGAKPYVL